MHESTIQYPCTMCVATFSRETYLKLHMEKHIPKSEWIWFCKGCDQNFPSEMKMRNHFNAAHQTALNACKHCDGIFQDKAELMLHMQQSHNKQKFQCSVCDFKCFSVESVREHFRDFHSGHGFKCHKCGNTFRNMVDVHAHISTIHGDLISTNPLNTGNYYSCSLCGSTTKTGMNKVFFFFGCLK